eukprot:1159773-Pelagomonas_calceolata.AAC.5
MAGRRWLPGIEITSTNGRITAHRNILIAMVFHQWLEGIGLGALIAIADFGLLKGVHIGVKARGCAAVQVWVVFDMLKLAAVLQLLCIALDKHVKELVTSWILVTCMAWQTSAYVVRRAEHFKTKL